MKKLPFLFKCLLFSTLIGLFSFVTIKAHGADLHNVQTIGQKNRNQAVGQGLQVGDSLQLHNLHVLSASGRVTVLAADSAGNVGYGGCGCILTDSIHITSSQILNSHTSAITLIAAPPAGHYITITQSAIFYTYGTTQYTASPFAFLAITEASGTGLTGSVYAISPNIIDAPNSTSGFFYPATTDNVSSIVRGQPVRLYAPVSISGGDGVADIIISYIIH